jgi:protein tyrosine/serine phosphatase
MFSRLHRFDAIDNVRDYGAYGTSAGRKIKPMVLFRSANHARATPDDQGRLAHFDLGAIIDLRRPSERRKQSSRRPHGFTGVVVESDHDDGQEAPHMTFLKTSDLTEESGRRFMTDTYAKMVLDPAHIDLFSRYFAVLADQDRAVLIHCAAGKDRTGVLAALTHSLMGVHRDDLLEDYLLTNKAVDLERRAPSIAKQLSEMSGRSASHAAVVAFIGVEEAFLKAAYAAINAGFGSLDAYFEQALGVTRECRAHIEARLSA